MKKNSHNADDKFTLSISLAVVNHLATNLYTDISSVLTEIVANAWDANATKVKIDYIINEMLKIQDNGIGMDLNDINQRYLMIAYEKRNEVELTPSPYSRKPMGRKGIGKLAPINIADKVVCESAKGNEKNGLEIDYRNLLATIQEKNAKYHPQEVECTIDSGTRITLKDFKKTINMPTEQTIRRQLARKFSVIGSPDFKVILNGKEVTVGDREDLKKVEYIWVFGDKSKSLVNSLDIKYYDNTDDAVSEIKANKAPDKIGFVLGNNLSNNEEVSGWIGTSNKPRNLKTNYGSLNSIIVLSRGRNIQNNILDDITDARVFKSYITGTIEADYLDDDNYEDMASSAREALLKSDPRYIQLQSFLDENINTIGNDWDKLRRAAKAKEQFSLFPALKEWIDSLDERFKDDAEKTLNSVVNLHSKPEEKEMQREILKGAIYGFERLKANNLQHKFHESLNSDVTALLGYLEDRNKLEGSLLYDVTKSRLDAVNELISLKDKNATEAAFQHHLGEHLWLLDSGWGLADNIPSHIEKSINKIFNKIIDALSDEQKNARLDIKYTTHAGEHIIVELKRESRHNFTIYDLAEQGEKYFNGLKKGLSQSDGKVNYNIETIFIIGDKAYENLLELYDLDKMRNILDACKGRIVTYSQLITNAQRQYESYLVKQEKVAGLAKIVDNL